MSHLMTKPTKWSMCPGKTQISLGICPVWSESSQCTQLVAEDPVFLHADNEDSDQTGQMPRLIWVFAGRTGHFVGFVMRQLKWGNILLSLFHPCSVSIPSMFYLCSIHIFSSNRCCWAIRLHGILCSKAVIGMSAKYCAEVDRGSHRLARQGTESRGSSS